MSYETPNISNVIHDGNCMEHAAAVSLDASGAKRLRGYIPRNWSQFPQGCLTHARPFDVKLIPRSEWDARIEEKDRSESSLHHLRRRLKMVSLDQNGTNYCWFNATMNCLRLVMAYQQGVAPDLSPASGAAIIKGYSNSGGWSGEAIDFLASEGVCESKYWPPNAISRQYDTAESQANRKLYRVTKWLDLSPTFDEVATGLLLDKPVAAGLNWWAHEVCYLRLIILPASVINANYQAAKGLVRVWGMNAESSERYLERVASKYGVNFWNSWGEDYEDQGESNLTESRATPGDAIAAEVTSVVHQATAA